MSTNGHFAALGSQSDKTAYDNGVQVVDESKEFKYDSPSFRTVLCCPRIAALLNSDQSSIVSEAPLHIHMNLHRIWEDY